MHVKAPAWKALRKIVFEREGYRGVDCGEEAGWFKNGSRDMRGLECDHETYIRMFRELPQDCRTRCRPCHQQRHAGQSWKRIPLRCLKCPPPNRVALHAMEAGGVRWKASPPCTITLRTRLGRLPREV